jgi:acetoin utilization protein AcuB
VEDVELHFRAGTFIGSAQTLQDAIELMQQRHIRHLPVVDGDRMVGLVTDRDLRRAAPSPLLPRQAPETLLETTRVDRVMLKEPQTIAADRPLRDALQLFVDKKYGALPVMDQGRLVGIITPIDVMRHLLKTGT